MKVLSLLLVMGFGFAHAQAEPECTTDALLTYNISYKGQGQELKIYRQDQRVLRVFSVKGMTEGWNKTPTGRLKLTRYFDMDKQGIEYQPGEEESLGKKTWQQIQMGVPPNITQHMNLVSTQGTGCQLIETYESPDKKETYSWYPQRQVLLQYNSERGNPLSWTLTSDKTGNFDQAFALREEYRLIDYADIGDREDDPFVKKMINWGFIDHGASGFYDHHGHALPGQHHGQHHEQLQGQVQDESHGHSH